MENINKPKSCNILAVNEGTTLLFLEVTRVSGRALRRHITAGGRAIPFMPIQLWRKGVDRTTDYGKNGHDDGRPSDTLIKSDQTTLGDGRRVRSFQLKLRAAHVALLARGELMGPQA